MRFLTMAVFRVTALEVLVRSSIENITKMHERARKPYVIKYRFECYLCEIHLY